ncbi:aminoacyl--tRNA ligase-related protein [Actinomadura fibrosa]|uniref:Aminoacyl--tRNA ligase-related protein n=1 Tax=Actinomadura fibrosa TaxID=111802 RepID=A0ABW2XVU2_9ACTN|nr:aminoacyl--tRNA ligase-related protein [Actinomadura fibrosa]
MTGTPAGTPADVRAAAPRTWFDARAGADGRATFGPDSTRLIARLDREFASWGEAAGAVPATYPPLVPVADLAELDYFDNFPHLVSLAAPLDPARLDGGAAGPAASAGAVPPDLLAPAALALPSATCYGVYLDLRDRVLDEPPLRITAVATCFRREERYEGLRRLLGFRMREVVCAGTRDDVLDHLAAFRARILGFTARLGLPVEVADATDPFFAPDGARGLMQRLFPVKKEFLFGGELAIASVNFHRNFFGERCRIVLADGTPAFTGCAAFGLERWLAALSERFGGDAAAAAAALEAACADPR